MSSSRQPSHSRPGRSQLGGGNGTAVARQPSHSRPGRPQLGGGNGTAVARQPSHSLPGRPQLGSENGTAVGGGASIDDIIGTDLVHNILSRLPAIPFACAACVNRAWNSTCTRILSVPKLSSAFSQNPSVEGAVNEVTEKVLSEPIRPDFVIASTSEGLNRSEVHNLLTKRFGSSAPIVTCLDFGIIAKDSLTDEVKEIQWEDDLENDDEDDHYGFFGVKDNFLPKGLVLTVGYLPGLKGTLIPLPSTDKANAVDKFVKDIRSCASAAPHNSPSAIILFSDLVTNMKPILQKLDYAFPRDTVIVGQDGRCLSYRSNWDKNNKSKQEINPAVVALVFVKDRENPSGSIEGIQFHATLSAGLRPVGPVHRARSVKYQKNECATWLTARVGAAPDLDGQTILDNIYNEIGDGYQNFKYYIGVEKWRNCSVGTDRPRAMTFLEFHEVFGGNEEYLFVNEGGMRTGDHFRFFITDPKAAMDSRNRAFAFFKSLKPNYTDASASNQQPTAGASGNIRKMSVFGCLIFACIGRCDAFFGSRPGMESQPFLDNFPGVPFAGAFCNGEIASMDQSIYEDSQDGDGGRCSLHQFGTVYLALSYTPANC